MAWFGRSPAIGGSKIWAQGRCRFDDSHARSNDSLSCSVPLAKEYPQVGKTELLPVGRGSGQARG